ncbi:hypothetical protein [Pedobacter sp. SYSU D00535]|uniref:hypothetical protein n=1 Tax=Pedobacter sp. SYSU D00535 TaxID=2810308 RepID=UPI001A95EA6D|nr:hypothetical protein [Pedobacter sp. SYSU D00535]
MENEQEKNPNGAQEAGHDNTIGGAQTNQPDPEATNDTGYQGTTNAVSESFNEEDGYKLAVEDTMIGYDGNEDQMNMDFMDEEAKKRSGHSGADDNS